MDIITRTNEQVRDDGIAAFEKLSAAVLMPPHPDEPGCSMHLGCNKRGNPIYFTSCRQRDDRLVWTNPRVLSELEYERLVRALKLAVRLGWELSHYYGDSGNLIAAWEPAEPDDD